MLLCILILHFALRLGKIFQGGVVLGAWYMCVCVCRGHHPFIKPIFSDSGFRWMKKRMGWGMGRAFQPGRADFLAEGIKAVSRSRAMSEQKARGEAQFTTWQDTAMSMRKTPPSSPARHCREFSASRSPCWRLSCSVLSSAKQ